MYTYKYPHPAMTADCVVFGYDISGDISLLLIERGNEPYKGCWAFPGGFMNIDETIEQCASRELKEETGLEITDWQQIGVYSAVDRDARERVVTTAFYSLINQEEYNSAKGGDDARAAKWFKLCDLPKLAFDHEQILDDALKLTCFSRKKHINNLLLSEAIGDICGSSYEFNPEKDYNKLDITRKGSDYTDDTVCTFAVADALINNKDMAGTLQKYCRRDRKRGYGGRFRLWIREKFPMPYGSYGNGSAMRCSAAGFMAKSLEECEYLAKKSANCTHNHPEGIKGAVATAKTIYLLLQGATKDEIKAEIFEKYYPEWREETYAKIHDSCSFDESCQKTVPASLICFLESHDYADTIRKCIALGGDADTLAAIAGPMAFAYYKKMPDDLLKFAYKKLPHQYLLTSLQFDAFAAI